MSENADVGSCFKTPGEYPGLTRQKRHGSELPGNFYVEKGMATLRPAQLMSKQCSFVALDVIQREHSEIITPIVSAAAMRGDVSFFLRIASEIKRVAQRKRRSTLVLHMLNNWLHGFLWLMPSIWGSDYLQRITGETVSQEKYEKLRQRLKLVGWEAKLKHPLIEGYNPTTGEFTFREGWTNLNPDSSR